MSNDRVVRRSRYSPQATELRGGKFWRKKYLYAECPRNVSTISHTAGEAACSLRSCQERQSAEPSSVEIFIYRDRLRRHATRTRFAAAFAYITSKWGSSLSYSLPNRLREQRKRALFTGCRDSWRAVENSMLWYLFYWLVNGIVWQRDVDLTVVTMQLFTLFLPVSELIKRNV